MQLYSYQLQAAEAAFKQKKFALFMQMGLGKTLTSLYFIKLALQEAQALETNKWLRTYFRFRVLVIAPKQVCLNTWPKEIEGCNFYEGDYTIRPLTGDAKQRNQMLHMAITDSPLSFYIVNKENVNWVTEKAYDRFDIVIVDESSFFKCHSTKRSKAARKLCEAAKYVLLLSGTPISNNLIDIWSQMALVDNGERLEKSFFKFKNTYFYKTFNGFSWIPHSSSADTITKKIADVSVTIVAADNLFLPPIVYRKLYCTLDPAYKIMYKQLEKNFLATIDDTIVTAPTAAVLSNKLKQFCSGGLYAEGRDALPIPTQKIEILKDILDTDVPILVAYNYKFEKELLLRTFGCAVDIKDEGAIDAWNEGKIKLLVAHPLNAGYGLNLQAGGNVVVWFSLPWSLEQYQQLNARLHRQGQKETTIIHNLLVQDTIEERVFSCLTDKKENQDSFIDLLRSVPE